MRTPLIRQYIFQNKKRTLAALVGICFAMVLLFIQVGFAKNGKRISCLLYHYLDFDLIITSNKYQLLDNSHHFDKMRLIQAKLVPGINFIEPLNYGRGVWLAKGTKIPSSVLIFGVSLNLDLFLNEEIRAGLPKLTRINTVLLDRLSRDEYGDISVMDKATINNTEVTVAALFPMGMRFQSDGAVITSNNTFRHLYTKDLNRVNFGLIKLKPGVDVLQTKTALKKNLPSDVLVFTKQELIQNEQHYFVTIIPVGILFQIGLVVGLVIGGLLLYQVLFADINKRLREFATLKAMGFSSFKIYFMGIKMGFYYAIIAYLPALAISYLSFRWIAVKSKLPLLFSLDLAGFVFILTLVMCLASTFLALRVLKKADPVDLF